MSLKKDGIMIILSSPSGAGKTTLTNLLSKKFRFNISVSHTTRKPRPREIHSKHYFFVKKKEFNGLILNNKFLEYAKVFNNFYGTSKDYVFKMLKNGKDVLFDIDWQGAQQIKRQTLNFNLITFFILPPSKEVLLQRLISRGESKDDIIQMRMNQFDKDVLHWVDYDFVVINEDLNECYREIVGFLEDKTKYDKSKIQNHIKKLI